MGCVVGTRHLPEPRALLLPEGSDERPLGHEVISALVAVIARTGAFRPVILNYQNAQFGRTRYERLGLDDFE